jgi:hypothetical protein
VLIIQATGFAHHCTTTKCGFWADSGSELTILP